MTLRTGQLIVSSFTRQLSPAVSVYVERSNCSTGAARGSYMGALVPFETLYASQVLVLRVPAFCYVAPVQCRQRGTARKSILSTVVDGGVLV